MKILDKINEIFGFTRAEQRVVLFLMLSFAAGAAIKYFRNSSSPGPSYDYSSLDSEFAARSKLIDSLNVPVREEDSLVHVGLSSSVKDTGTVNINTATKDMFVHMPGIGDAIAERIIVYRKEHGQFHAVKELMNIKGIGRKKFDRIAKRCSVH